jgi:hypothetical protein
MWKQIAATILLVAFANSTFCNAIIVVDYYTNTTLFAKHCINKTRPAMHCNGKCQVMKKLQQEERKEQGNTERKAEIRIPVISSKSFFDPVIRSTSCGQQCYIICLVQKPIDRTSSLFQPPRES